MSKGKLVAVVMVWLVLFGIGAVGWKFLIQPRREVAEERRRTEMLQVGSSDSRYDHRVNLQLDSFSGYAVLRSEAFAKELSQKSIKVNLIDDQADYGARLKSLQNGETQFAVFTIDALLKTCAEAGELPASIVAMIDETRGADAVVGYQQKFQSVDDFNDPSVRFVLTPDSPSETLARVVMTHFELPNLAQDPIVAAKDARDVYERYRQASQDGAQVFVLWEPYVSKMLENPNMHTIVSTRDLFGYIVDVLVVSRQFLQSNEQVAREVVECYFRAAYQHRGKMTELVLDDAKRQGEALSRKQADRLVEGVQWKDTQRNYAHFGIQPNSSVEHIEDMIGKISKVLIATGAMNSDPTGGKPNLLFYDKVLQNLYDEQFHPSGQMSSDGLDDTIKLRALNDQEWNAITTVGTLRVPRLVFAPSKAVLLSSSRATLEELANTLRTQRYYLKIRGVATRQGSREKNLSLAEQRAQAAFDDLKDKGIAPERMRAMEPTLGDVPSVQFTLGQLPY